MESLHQVKFSQEFKRRYKKLLKRNPFVILKVDNVIDAVLVNPFQPGLKTHKANIKGYGEGYSTRVTGDIRIGWDFKENNTTILIVTIGGHEGKHKVYKELI